MARFTLCFILLAAALGHAIEPPATLDRAAPNSSFVIASPQIAAVDGQLPLMAAESPNDMQLGKDNDDICYKIRAYIFKRDDDHAPQYVGSTTCGPRQPRAKNAEWPKARLVPAN
jgi:hypothetical protein